jgi:hypothetical protein
MRKIKIIIIDDVEIVSPFYCFILFLVGQIARLFSSYPKHKMLNGRPKEQHGPEPHLIGLFCRSKCFWAVGKIHGLNSNRAHILKNK